MNTHLLDVWNLNSTWNLLSSISSGDKLSIRGSLIVIDKNTPLLFLKRKYYGDKRENIFNLLNILFDKTLFHLKEQNDIKENNLSIRKNIISGLNGIICLRDTYNDDIRFLSLLNSLLEKIKKLEPYFKHHNTYNDYKLIESKILLEEIDENNNNSNNNNSNNNNSNNNNSNNNNSNNNNSNNNKSNNNKYINNNSNNK